MHQGPAHCNGAKQVVLQAKWSRCSQGALIDLQRILAQIRTRSAPAGFEGTDLARAQCRTIRLNLLKIGAQIQVTVRRVWMRMAAGYPKKSEIESNLSGFATYQELRRGWVNTAG